MKKIICLLFLILISFPLDLSSQKDTLEIPIPPELLFEPYKQRNFKISPNGKFFLEVLNENFENYIVIVDIDGYKLKNRIPMDNKGIGEVAWLTNTRIIYESAGEIYAIDTDGTNRLKLISRQAEKKVKNYYRYHMNFRYNSILSMMPDTSDEVLIESFDTDGNAYAKKVNVFTGERETILDGKKLNVNKWFADKNGKIILGARVSEDSWEYVRESVNSDEWFPIELNFGEKYYPFKLDGVSFLDQNALFVETDYEEDIIYVASNIDFDKRNLLKYDLRLRKVVDTLVTDVNCDVMDDEGEDIRLLFDPIEKKLGGIRYEGILPEFRATTDNFVKVESALREKFGGFVNDILDVDDAFKRFVIHQWSDTYAGNIGIFDAASGQYYVMFHFNQELNNYKLCRSRSITINTKDDYRLSAYLTLPHKYDTLQSIPLLVIPHGGPWARDYWGMNPHAQFFASRGYAVLRTNFRGSTGFGKKHLQAGIEGIGSVMIDDIAEAAQNVMDNYKIDPKAVFIYGHSYGGYATYMSLAKYPDLYRSGVAVAAPTDIKKMLKLQKKENKDFSYDYWTHALGDNGSKYYDLVSPINYVQQITSPVLVFHGQKDRIVPIDQAEQMEKEFKRFSKSNGTFRTVQFLGHSLEDSNSHGYVLKEAEEFFTSTEE